MTRRRRGVAVLTALLSSLALGLSLALSACRVDEAAFEATIFSCNTTDPGCGKTAEGREMTCFQASQLDGTNFCAPKCDMAKTLAEGPDDGATVCVHGDAELHTCDPTVDGSCGGGSLRCLRTEVATYEGKADEGVCMTMTPCTSDYDCRNAVHSTCATTFLNELYSHNDAEGLHSDHLYCLQRNCKSGGSACSPGQSCLPYVVDQAAHPPDICVPNCGSDDSCPPNHFCFQRLSGLGSPRICLPGLLGFLCESDIDCMVGTCMNDGGSAELSLNLCTVPCGRDEDCAKWDSDQGKFICSEDGRCITPDAYRGARCTTDDDCTRDEGTSCVFSGKPTQPTDQGTCSVVCGDGVSPDTVCEPRGGFGQVCLPNTVDRAGVPKHVCFPGYFGYPCTLDTNCVGGMKCRQPAAASPRTICTITCMTDKDCDEDNRFVAGQAFCGPNGACVPLVKMGDPCQANNQCASKVCLTTGKCQ